MMALGALARDDRLFFEAISDGLTDYLATAERRQKLIAEAQARVAKVLADDAKYREEEERRKLAIAELEVGIDRNIDDAIVRPTDELLRSGEFITRRIAGEQWTDKSVTGYRRLHIMQITYLASRGVLDDQLYSACKWYRERYEAAQMEPSAAVAQYGETVRGDPIYGPLPRNQWAAEARTDFRWARYDDNGFEFPKDLLALFDLVVLKDLSMKSIAAASACHFRNVRAAFIQAAHVLHGRIEHRLKI